MTPPPVRACAEFRPLFRERDIAAGRLTVLVVSQRTDHDMATWSEHVEAERLELASQVGQTAAGQPLTATSRRDGSEGGGQGTRGENGCIVHSALDGIS